MVSREVPSTAETANRFRRFGTVEAPNGCPLYATLALRVAEDPALLALAEQCQPGQPPANMLFGAVRYLLQETPDPRIDGPFRTGQFDEDPYPAFRSYCLEYETRIAPILQIRRTQTNEVGRCGLWMPALAQLCTTAAQPVALIEIGASAGLNLQFDRYRYDYGQMRLGPDDSPVRLSCDLRGEPMPRIEMPVVAHRHGIDLNPIDPRNEQDQRWLIALVWPGQPEREARLRAALRLASEDNYTVEGGDALARLPELIAEIGKDHLVCVLHTFVVYQFTAAQRAALQAILENGAGEVVRIAIETNKGGDADIELHTYTADKAATRLLATADPHGRWMNWSG